MASIINILKNKCPNCGDGQIFTHKNIYFNFSSNEMNKTCKKCGFKFEKEPGFFFGAMYVSYALGVVQALVTALVASFFYEQILSLKIFMWIISVLLVMSSFNMRVSRIIWIYLFKNI